MGVSNFGISRRNKDNDWVECRNTTEMKTIVRDILSSTVLLIKLIVLCCSPSVKCIICLGSLMTTASMLWLGIGLTVG